MEKIREKSQFEEKIRKNVTASLSASSIF